MSEAGGAGADRPLDTAGATGQPFRIGPREGRAPRLETLASELLASRTYLLRATRGLDADALRAPAQGTPNTVGMVLTHIAAAERLFQRITGDGTGFTEEDAPHEEAFRFRGDPLAGRPLDAYVDHLAAVRRDTLALFAERTDAWLDEDRTFAGHPSNTHYYWLHLLMDEARHTGQIILLRKYLLPGADASFDPYALR